MLYGVMYETAHRPHQSNGWRYLRFESQYDARDVVENQAREIILQKNDFEHALTWEKKLSTADIRLVYIWRLESESINELVPLNHRGVATVDPTIWTFKGTRAGSQSRRSDRDGAWFERRIETASENGE